MKRPGDMRRRRQAAYRRGWAEAMAQVASRIESLRTAAKIDGHAITELTRLVAMDPPELSEPGDGHDPHPAETRRDLRA